MLTADGYFERAWLSAQDTDRLRYEARCERVRHADSLPRHTLLLVLGQLPIITDFPEKVTFNGQDHTQ